MIFKVIFGSEIHIIKSTDKQKFQQFLSVLPTVFKSLPNRYKLSYLDEEGDEITFEDQNDYNILLGTGQRSVKIIIREDNEEFIEMTNEIHIDPVHQDIIEQ
jgi:translation elongation factor P/translation initiation factor 5A